MKASVLVTTEYYQYLFFWSELCHCHPLSLKPHETFRKVPKSLLRADATETWEQQLFRTAEHERKATENPLKTEVKNSAAWIMVTGYPPAINCPRSLFSAVKKV